MKQMIIRNQDTEQEMLVPAKNVLCGECEGDGKVDNPAFSNGITQSEREDMGEEDFQNYMDGRYDVVCPCCKGARVIQVVDVPAASYQQKRFMVEVRRDQIEQAQYRREDEATRRAEMRFCGYDC